MYSIIDTHIHLDMYANTKRNKIIETLDKYKIEALISVSTHLKSSKENLNLSKKNSKIKPAFGFHPEQKMPTEDMIQKLFTFIDNHAHEMIAIGEVGLPYYLRREDQSIPIEPYVELLEAFIKKAKQFNCPIALHAIYDDAPIVCHLLEKYSIQKAHFHWFKGEAKTIDRLKKNGYYISITPDIFYKERTRKLIEVFPIQQIMVETDGPWRFEGPFKDKMTHPSMLHEVIKEISKVKKIPLNEVYTTLYENSKNFYSLTT